MTCHKIWYSSESEAKQAIRVMHQNNRASTVKAYRCPFCGRWHLTTLSRRRWKKLKKELDLV